MKTVHSTNQTLLAKCLAVTTRALVTLLLWSATLATSTASERIAQNQISVFVRPLPQTWPQAKEVEWPGNERSVGVLFNATRTSKICGKALSGVAKSRLSNGGIAFGVACRRLWVLMAPIPLNLSMHELEAIASHEAIHAITLATAFKARLDVAGAHEESRSADRHIANRFFNQLVETGDLKISLSSGDCSKVLAEYNGLSGPELAYVKDQIHTEWPAELYMRTQNSMRDDSSYLRFRRKISRGNDLEPSYIAGGIAMTRIDYRLGRENWQRRLLSGESLVGMLFESIGCIAPKEERQPLAVVRGQLPSLVGE